MSLNIPQFRLEAFFFCSTGKLWFCFMALIFAPENMLTLQDPEQRQARWKGVSGKS